MPVSKYLAMENRLLDDWVALKKDLAFNIAGIYGARASTSRDFTVQIDNYYTSFLIKYIKLPYFFSIG